MASGEILQFPLRRGLAEDGNPKAKPISTLRAGVNIRWPRDGVIGKRLGTESLPVTIAANGGNIASIQRFVVRGRELSVTDGETLYTYNETSEEWTAAPDVPELGLEWSTLSDDSTGVAASDIAIVGNYIVHAWVTGDPTGIPEVVGFESASEIAKGSGFVQVLDRRTHQVLLRPTRLDDHDAAGIAHIRIVTASTYAFVLHSGYDGEIVATALDLSGTPTVGAETAIVTDLESSSSLQGRFDALFASTGNLIVVYEREDGMLGSNLAAARWSRSGATLSHASTNDLTEDTVKSISICEDTAGTAIGILYCHEDSSPDHRVRFTTINNTTLSEVLAPATVRDDFLAWQVELFLVATETFGIVFAGVDQVNADSDLHFPLLGSLQISSASGSIVSNSARYSAALSLLSRSFTVGGRRYVIASDARYGERGAAIAGHAAADLNLVPSVSSYVLEIDDPDSALEPPHRMVGKIDHDIASMVMIGLLPNVASVDSNDALAMVPYQASAAAASFGWRSGLRLLEVTSDADTMSDPWRSVSVGQEAYISGARLSAWDGRTVFDHGMRAPFVVTNYADANIGALDAGTYLYQFGATFRSGAGVLHRGPLSAVQTTSADDNDALTFVLSPQSIDGKQTVAIGFGANSPGQAYIETYRSEANGSVLHKLTYEPLYNTTPNVPNDEYLTVADTRNDDDILPATDPALPEVALSSRPQPYTATGELEDVQPPAQYTLHHHNHRLFLITGGRREVWYSKDTRENPGIAPGFNPVQVELYDEDLVGCASMDDKRIMFSERRIWYVVGDGPTVAGTDNRFSSPQIVQTDVGCTNPRSIVSWPFGVMFQSGTDVYNLTRGLTVEWIGKDARETFATYHDITSAVLVPSENEVRFTCNGATRTYEYLEGDSYGWVEGETEGRIVVYDYARNTWSVRTYPELAPIVDATLCDGDYVFATADTVRRELTDTHLDDGAYVESDVELEDITPAGVVGWQRVRIAKLLGQSLSNHALTISVARDFATTYEQTESFAAGTDVTTPGAHSRAEVALTVQRRQAVRVRITDAAPANTTTHPLANGTGFQLEGVALLVQPKPGLPRDTSSRRGG